MSGDISVYLIIVSARPNLCLVKIIFIEFGKKLLLSFRLVYKHSYFK